jgi:ABC-type multidrug transport system ATPase subunit
MNTNTNTNNDIERPLLTSSSTPTPMLANGNNNNNPYYTPQLRAGLEAFYSPPPESSSNHQIIMESTTATNNNNNNLSSSGGGAPPLERRPSSIQRPTIDAGLEVRVEVSHLDYFVGNPKKHILKDISLEFVPGKISAVMGPSGSGKTTLINCILGNASGIIENGEILVNGLKGPPRHFKSVAKLIPQEDILLPSFTVVETLSFHAELVLPQATKPEERRARIDAIITALGLKECENVRIGSVEERGISGGQRKRVSIALELLSNPAVLCVDEPTSGLDSHSAEVVIKILKDLSHVAGKRTILTTIHQPSFRIFSLFDNVVLLTRGRVAYSGPMNKIEPFFTSIGHIVPPKENPADHYMRLLQNEELIEKIPNDYQKELEIRARAGQGDYYRPAPPIKFISPNKNGDESDTLSKIPLYPTSTFHQIKVLFRRQSLDSVKDTNKFLRMLGIKAAVGVMVGVVWWKKADPPRQAALLSIQGALFMLVFNGVIETLALTILSFPLVRSLLLREYKNGNYSIFSFYVAVILSMTMFGILYVLVMAIPIYTMVGFPLDDPKKMAVFATGLLLNTMIGNALGVTVGASAKDLIEAQNSLAPILAPLMLFSGFILQKDEIPKVFLPFYYISFFQYAIGLFEINAFTGMIFADYNMDIFHPMQIRPLKHGEQVLKGLDLDPETHHVGDYLWILFGYASALTIIGYFVVKRAVARRTN